MNVDTSGSALARRISGKEAQVLEFEVSVDGDDGCAIITVEGELDIATAPQLVAAIDGVAAGGAAKVAVDLLGTSFIDSTGLTTLFRAHKRFESDGRPFVIICGPDNVEVLRVVDLMGFNQVFTMFETRAAAGCPDGAGPPS